MTPAVTAAVAAAAAERQPRLKGGRVREVLRSAQQQLCQLLVAATVQKGRVSRLLDEQREGKAHVDVSWHWLPLVPTRAFQEAKARDSSMSENLSASKSSSVEFTPRRRLSLRALY